MENGKNEVILDKLAAARDVPKKLELENNNVVTPNVRPVRERKAVDKYSISSPDSRSSGSKPLSIAKGSGTPLKDIPNVAFKLSKRKPDDTLQLLHMILFGKRAKVHTLKKDIGLFSGFVWEANEEKHRAKMKEKLDKCVKDKLLDFCDMLNIPVKSTVKKEYLLIKLLEFLESPHATTEVLLADKEQKSNKQKRSATSSKSSYIKAAGENSAEKTQSGEKRKRSATVKENETDDIDDKMSSQSHSSGEEADVLHKQDSDQKRISSDEENGEVKDKMTSPTSSSKDDSKEKRATKSENIKKCSSEKSTKIPATYAKKTEDTPKNSKSAKKTKDTPKYSKSAKKTEGTPKNSKSAKKTIDTSEKSSSVIESFASPLKAKGSASKKRQKVHEETKNKKSVSVEKSPSKKQTSKSDKSVEGKEETNKEDKVEPPKEELHAVAVNILKEVDFNTATLSDILRLLGSHFGVDLKHRKSDVKAIIQEAIESMSDGDSDKG